MKVILGGRAQRGWAIEVTCSGHGNGDGGCGARLLVEEEDLFKTFSHVRDETSEYITFECCSCKVWTDLPKVPGPVRDRVKRSRKARS